MQELISSRVQDLLTLTNYYKSYEFSKNLFDEVSHLTDPNNMLKNISWLRLLQL